LPAADVICEGIMEIGPLNRVDRTSLNAESQTQRMPFVPRDLVTAVNAINDSKLLGDNRELSFRWDNDAHRPVIRIVQRETGDVIREIPPREVLRMMAEMERNKAKAKS